MSELSKSYPSFRDLPPGKRGGTYLIKIQEVKTGAIVTFACSAEQADLLWMLAENNDGTFVFISWKYADD